MAITAKAAAGDRRAPRDGSNLGAVIQAYMRTHAIATTGEMAAILGVDRTLVSKYLNGSRSCHDVARLRHYAVAMDLPPETFGLIAAPDDLPTAGAPNDDEAQQWRLVRRTLNRHRAELTRTAADLYWDPIRVAGTRCISRADWMPAEPVPLESIELDWNPEAARSGEDAWGGAVIIPGEPTGVAGSPPIRPSRRWYWVACGLVAGAVICSAFALAGFFSLNRQIKDFQRVLVPGQAEVTFARPGGYVLYIEQPGHCCFFSVGEGSAPFSNWSMNVGLQPVNGGPAVAISSWRGAIRTYGVAGHQGQSAMSFTIGQPGRYVLAASEVTPGSIVDVAVGRGIGGGVVVPVVLVLAGVFALLAGLVIVLVTAFRRRRARRRLLPAPQVVPPMGDGGPR